MMEQISMIHRTCLRKIGAGMGTLSFTVTQLLRFWWIALKGLIFQKNHNFPLPHLLNMVVILFWRLNFPFSAFKTTIFKEIRSISRPRFLTFHGTIFLKQVVLSTIKIGTIINRTTCMICKLQSTCRTDICSKLANNSILIYLHSFLATLLKFTPYNQFGLSY